MTILVAYTKKLFDLVDNSTSDQVLYLSRNHQEIKNSCGQNWEIEDAQIDDLISKYTPNFERWCSISKIPLALKEMRFYVHDLYAYIEQNSVDLIILPTSSPHHLDTTMFAILSELTGIKVLYLYTGVLEDFIVPVLQSGQFTNRKHIRFWRNTPRKTKILKNFVNNLKSGHDPTSQARRNVYNKSIYISTLLILLYCLRRYIGHALANKGLSPIERKFLSYSIVTNLKFTWRQYKYLKKMKVIRLIPTLEDDGIIFYANFQPEATTFPEAMDFEKITTALDKIKEIFPNRKIYFKEHPSTQMYYEFGHGPTKVGNKRNESLFDYFSKNQISVLPIESRLHSGWISSKNILEITVNGTLNLERHLQGLSSGVLAKNWYSSVSSIISLEKMQLAKNHCVEKKINDQHRQSAFDEVQQLITLSSMDFSVLSDDADTVSEDTSENIKILLTLLKNA